MMEPTVNLSPREGMKESSKSVNISKRGEGGSGILSISKSSTVSMSRDEKHNNQHKELLQTSVSEKRISSSKVQPSSASSLELLTKMALEYSLYFRTDLSAQISKLEEYLQESIAKLEEQQSLFEIKEIETREWIQVILPQLVSQAQVMSSTMHKRLDTLNELIVSVKHVLDQLEKQIVLAEQKMGLNPAPGSFRSVFKYFMKADNSDIPTSSDSEVIGWEAAKPHLMCQDPLHLETFFK